MDQMSTIVAKLKRKEQKPLSWCAKCQSGS
jgi:hypothetical protein